MKALALYWSFLVASYIVATQLRKTSFSFAWVQPSMMKAIYALCLIMGLRMGINEQITSNLGSIGIMSLIISAFCIAGSMAFVFLTRKILKMDRYGNVKSQLADKEESNVAGEQSQKLELKSTLIILGIVIGGVLVGALVLVRYFAESIGIFEVVTGYMLTALLCILLGLVGFDLGSTGNVFRNLKTAGLRVFAFPVAAVLGTLVIGSASCLVMGFSLRESVAIVMGLGWYTYAPVVIASAGPQFVTASAVSFMYNIIRETVGIIGIPFLAKKFGYLESTTIPGVAAMDVCMPIVERSCRQDTIVYSFAMGLFMCITAGVVVPLVMGV